jgi:peptidoglycan/LPS O-acetylase OafA/YrhL
VVLDSWRGVCACLVALIHFETYSHVHEWGLLRNAYLFVDFFFVLSGFVIASNYHERLLRGFDIGKFMYLRFARLYPLHFFVFLLFVVVELAHFMALDRPAFAEERSTRYVASNLLLIHGLGIHDSLSWNYPSWSVSVEFYSYVIYALLLRFFPRQALFGLGLAVAIGPLVILAMSHKNMDTTYSWGMVRCLYGFSAGVLTYLLWRSRKTRLGQPPENKSLGHAAELGVTALMCVFVAIAGTSPISVAAPLVFAAAVFSFASEAGVVSAVLRKRAFVIVGAASYSIYLIHVFLLDSVVAVAARLQTILGVPLFTSSSSNGVTRSVLGTSLWWGDLCVALFLGVLIATSYLLFRAVEQPSRRWLRAHAPGSTVPGTLTPGTVSGRAGEELPAGR